MSTRHFRHSGKLGLFLVSIAFCMAPAPTLGQPCTVDADCDDGDPCTADTCIDGACDHAPTNGCLGCDTGGSANCQVFGAADVNVLMADKSVLPHGAVHADDFVPETTEISSVCIWGAYIDANAETPDCAGVVPVGFRVVIYADAGGFPDINQIVGIAEFASDVIESVVPETGFEQMFGVPMRAYTISFPTITLPAAGMTYWLEVSANTFDPALDPALNTCEWHWAQAHFGPRGNRYAAAGNRPFRGGYGWPEPANFTGMSGRWTDLAFCLNGPSGAVDFSAPAAPVGACCDCDGICLGEMTLEDCVAAGGIWRRPQSCADAGACDAQPGDDCAAPIPINEGLHGFDTTCATVDTPAQNPELLGGELWFCYTSTSTGRLFVSMCPSTPALGGLDGMLRIYRDPIDPLVCPCPDQAQASSLVGEADGNCNGLADGGSGIGVPLVAFPGEKYLISVGTPNAQAAGGRGFLDLDQLGHCTVATIPTSESLFPGGPVSPKPRYLSVLTSDESEDEALRVKADSLPPPFDSWNGMKWFATEPFQVCENSGHGLAVAPPNCGPAPGQAQKWFWASRLTCEPSEAWYEDWTDRSGYCSGSGEACESDAECAAGTCGVDGTIHLVGPMIVPSRQMEAAASTIPSQYDVQAISASAFQGDELCYSLPVTNVVQSAWGDIVKDVTACPMGVPNGDVDVIGDVVAAVQKFSNLPCAPKKARADVWPEKVDFVIDFLDAVAILGAFSGEDYPFTPGDPCAP